MSTDSPRPAAEGPDTESTIARGGRTDPTDIRESGTQDSNRNSGEYVVVARRYRPQSFDELIGQQHVAQALCNAIDTNRVGHAYLFTGARGVGKTSAARILAKALNCVDGPTASPCGQCDICISVASGSDVDVLEIDGASNRGIDEIRQLRSNVNVRPSRARFKVYIIDEVHMLTREAFNALLKTLEEPPAHVKFIFCTTDPEKMPITVLSRCQRFDFAPVESNAIVDRLQQIVAAEGATAESEALMMLARRAAGSMRDSQSLLEQLLSFAGDSITVDAVHKMFGTARSGRIAALVDHLQGRDAAAALGELDAAVNEGVDIGQLAEQLVGHLRDMMAAGIGCDGELLLHNAPGDIEELHEKANAWGLETLLAALQILDHIVARMRQSIHRRTLVEMAIVRIANLGDLQQLSDLIATIKSGSSLPTSTASPPARSGTKKSTAKKNAPAENPGTVRSTSSTATANGSDETPASGTQVSDQHSIVTDAVELPTTTATAKPETVDLDAPTARLEFESVEPQVLWQQVAGSLDGVTGEVASDVANVTRLANKLEVTFPTAYGSSFCQRPERLAQLEKAVSRLVGKQIRLEFKHVDAPQRRNRDRPSGASMRELMRKSHELPLVRRAIELFDAEVTRVQPAEQKGG